MTQSQFHVFREFWPISAIFEKRVTNDGRVDGKMDGQMDGPTD